MSSALFAGLWEPDTGVQGLWVSAWPSFVDRWKAWDAEGLRLVDIDVFDERGERRYAGVWRAGTAPQGLWVNEGWDDFFAHWQTWNKQQLRLIALNVFEAPEGPRFSGVWAPGNDRHALYALPSWEQFYRKWQELSDQGLRLTDIEVYRSGGGLHFAGVWREGDDGHYLWVGTSREEFLAKHLALARSGLALRDLEIYFDGGQTRYAGVWRQGGKAQTLQLDLDWNALVSHWQASAGRGLCLAKLKAHRQDEVPAQQQRFGARPFYVLGHNTNTLEEVRRALEQGANALEPDINVYRHRTSELCISHGRGDRGAPKLVDFLRQLHTLVAQRSSPLHLIVFDCKQPATTAAHGETILNAVREHLTYDNQLTVILSVGKIAHAGMFDRIATRLGPREGLMIDAEDGAAQVVQALNAHHVVAGGYGNGLSFLGRFTVPYFRESCAHACALRMSGNQPKFVYGWTVNDRRGMREFIRMGVDGLITDDPRQLRAVMREFRHIRLAGRRDNPLRPANFGYALKVHTADIQRAGTDARIRFTLRGAHGYASVEIDTELVHRMERGDTNYLVLECENLGPLTHITVWRDNAGNAPGWRLTNVEVRSHRYGVAARAQFGVWIPRRKEVTRALTTL